ncbi:MAG: hypothetical protein QM808_02990 [Steroidobacteraceae bacterium]
MIPEETQPTRGGNGLALRLILSFFAGLFGMVMILIAPSADRPIGHYLFGTFCLGIAAVCFVHGRIQRVIGSFLASAVLVVTAWYLFTEIVDSVAVSESRSNPSVINAILALVAFGFPAAAYLRRARFGFGAEPGTETETIEIDDVGVVRTVGSINERIRWDDVDEIRIITTDDGPYAEDVFFAIMDGNQKGCLIPHDAAVKFKLLEQLQSRFNVLNDEAVIKAMGSTSNANFLIWKRPKSADA